MVALAGCGSTVARTRTLRDRPCATAQRITRCVADIARFTAARHGLKQSVVRVKCSRSHTAWTCLVLAPSELGPVCVGIPVYLTPEVGIPYPADGEMLPAAVCDKAFGTA